MQSHVRLEGVSKTRDGCVIKVVFAEIYCLHVKNVITYSKLTLALNTFIKCCHNRLAWPILSNVQALKFLEDRQLFEKNAETFFIFYCVILKCQCR